MAVLFFWLFLIALVIGIPVFFAMMLASIVDLIVNDNLPFLKMMVSRMYNGIDSFPMMAVPFFIFAGEVMNSSGTTKALIDFAKILVGHIRGGLAHVNILSSILFAGLSGSAVADTSALGSMLIPAMEKAGYSRRFSAAVTAASSVIGPIIPPSGLMILYAMTMEVPVAALFAAGFVPGLLIGVSLMGVAYFKAKKYNVAVEPRPSVKQAATATKNAILPLMTPVILLGGVLSGVFTPTESAAVAVCYAVLLSIIITRTLKVNDLPNIIRAAAINSAVVLLLVAASNAFTTVVTLSGIPEYLAQIISQVTQNPVVLMILINIFLLFVGMVLDAGPAILILGPILQPIVTQFGIDPVHFAVVMCVNVTVGLATPPMGLVLFVASSISKESLTGISKEIFPFLIAEIAVIFFIALVPNVILFLPRILGIYGG